MRSPMTAALLLAAAVLAGCGGSDAGPEGEAPLVPVEEMTTAPEPAVPPEATTTAEPEPEPDPAPEPKPKPRPGLPRYTAGYDSWPKLNARPLPPRDSDPHDGTKNVFASKEVRGDGLFPQGTIVVKEAMRPGADFIGLIAVMRKKKDANPEHNDWIFVEWTRDAPGARFEEVAGGAVCWGCHVGAADRDYVFTLSP